MTSWANTRKIHNEFVFKKKIHYHLSGIFCILIFISLLSVMQVRIEYSTEPSIGFRFDKWKFFESLYCSPLLSSVFGVRMQECHQLQWCVSNKKFHHCHCIFFNEIGTSNSRKWYHWLLFMRGSAISGESLTLYDRMIIMFEMTNWFI